MISELYQKDTYLNKDISHLYNHTIIEYDLHSANTSLCREYKLLPEDRIEEIESLPKDKRVRQIGLLMRKDKKFKENLKNAFPDIRRRFFEANNIQDRDILSIKKDAIFCLKECSNTKFGACVFAKKNVYTSYLYLNHLEIYYGPIGRMGDYKIDVKGISDIEVEKHKDGMLQFFGTLFRHMETSDYKTLMQYIRRFITKYKFRKLDVEYYREFDNTSVFRMMESDETYDDSIFIPYDDKVEPLCIDYNFINILIPLTQIFL